MACADYVEGDDHDPAPQLSQQIKREMLEGGVVLTHYGESTLGLTPPLIIEQDHIDQFVET